MDKTVLLKTQLHEASKLGKLKEFKYQRLSVILLDNFIEIQLRYLMEGRFYFDGFGMLGKKYKQKQRRNIVNYYEELLKGCVRESIISSDEKKLLLFCHEVRNNLYHKIQEEELLVGVAIRILHKIISEKQPGWGNAKFVTQLKEKTFDPFNSGKGKDSAYFNGNTEEEWEYFFKKYFNFIDKREKSVQALLSENIKFKIKQTKINIKFISEEFAVYFPYAKNWTFNGFCFFYSFKNINRDKIEEIKEDEKDGKLRYEELFNQYRKSWKNINKNKLEVIKSCADDMVKYPLVKSLEKYISIRSEMNMIYDAFNSASIELDKEIQFRSDAARGK